MEKSEYQDYTYRKLCSEKTLQSNTQGFFLSFADYVAEEAGEKWIKSVFGKLETDEERIKCVYTSKEIAELVKSFLSNVKEVYRPKNAEFSQKKRLDADALMKSNEHRKALIVFCQSVLRAPKTGQDKTFESGLSLALALWGRSQCLMKLQKFSKALVDIQQALKENLPGSYKAEAFWNMGICYKAQGQENKAKVSFDLAEKLLQNDEEKIALLDKDKMRGYDISNNIGSDNGMERPQIAGSIHSDLQGASSKLSLKSSKNMGRHIVANQKISTGETLVVESPYVACLLPDMFGTHCHHCFKSLESAFGCNDCAGVAFCSTECREQALSTYHRYECKFLDLLIGSGMSVLGHMALRMVTQSSLQKCLELYRNKDKEKIFQLCTNSHLRSPDDFLQRTLMAAFLLRCLQKSNFFGNASDDDNNSSNSEQTIQLPVLPSKTEYQLGEILLFNLQILQFNAHEVYETKHDQKTRIRSSKIAYIGVALYLTASLFNHDCHPALCRHFLGKDIVLTSSRPLKPNELVPENYGPIFTRRPLIERKRSLISRYWFDCQCLACQQDWPSIGRGLEDVSKRLRCPTMGCEQTFTLPIAEETTLCSKCRKTVNLSNGILLLKWCEEQYRLAFELMDTHEEPKKAIDILCVAIDTYYKLSLPPNKDTYLAEEMLRTCLADSGNTRLVPV